MLDCTKRLVDLTPYESYQCFLQADIWQAIGKNLRRMWADFTGTTIGDWGAIIFAFALVPAQLASYILPFIFCSVVMKRYGGAKHAFIFDGGEQGRKNFWGAYLLLSGVILVALYWNDRFMLIQGSWEIVCGVAIFLLGPSWWAKAQKKSVASP